MIDYNFENKIKELPESVIPEVNNYIDFLLTRYGNSKKNTAKFKFDR